MLQTISLRDFVIVDQLELDFSSGFTVLTGEIPSYEDIMMDQGYHPLAYGCAFNATKENNTVTFYCSSSSD